MRPQIQVEYELSLIDGSGEEMIVNFNHCFDSELYDESADLMIVNFKVNDLRDEYGDLFLLEWSVDRGGVCH